MHSGDTSIHTTISDDCKGMRLDRALATLVPDLSRERLKSLILDAQVSAKLPGKSDRVMTDPAHKVNVGDAYAITLPPPTSPSAQAQEIALTIVHEDAHLLVIDKPAGMVVHPAAGNLDGTLVNALLHHCAGQLSGISGVARPGIVHRIDKDTSGLLVVAKTDKAHEGLSVQFKEHSIDRRYIAMVHGRCLNPAGTVDTWIGRSDGDRKKMAVQSEGRGKHAVTHFTVTERLRDSTVVECRLETGRTHQVRVHMAHIGHPLLGDPVYSRAKKPVRAVLETLGFNRQALHAARLGFIHPVTGNAIAFDSELPADMQVLLSALRV